MNHDICIHSVKKITLRAKVLTADDGEDTVSVLCIRFSDGSGPASRITEVTAFLRADVAIADLDSMPLLQNHGGCKPWREINLTDVDVDVDNG